MPEAAANAAPGTRAGSAGGVLPLECAGVAVSRDGRALLDGVDLRLDGDGVTVLLGPNGAGKSLLLRVLANLVAPDRGTVRWSGTPPDRARATRIGFVFQSPVMLRRSVAQNVAYALGAVGVARRLRPAAVLEVLALASLAHLADAPARVLSGGEQQRLAIARALATAPQVLFLDEPTSSLDPAATLAVERLVRAARGRGTGIVLVTHDVGQARRLGSEVIFMHRGRIDERNPALEFFRSPASDAARAFLDGEIVV